MLKKTLLVCQILLLINTAFADDNSLQRRVFMLENALAPKSPLGVAQSWGNAVMHRNGAVQYMLLCPQLQTNYLSQLQELNWVTGLSSPMVKSYKAIPVSNNRFKIIYTMQPEGNTTKTVADQLTIVKVSPSENSSQQWCINQFSWLSPAAAH